MVTDIVADMVWPALVLEQRLVSVLPITVGLMVEWLALWLGGFGLSWKKAAVVDVVMNTVSTAAGSVVIPLLGFIYEFFPGSIIYAIFHVGTFNRGTWAATFFLAVLATTSIEFGTLKWVFKLQTNWRRYGVLLAANTVSVAVAFVSLWTHPPTM
jgi:hypothetical protein